MGGFGSTRWGGHVRRRTVTAARAVEARTLARELGLPPVVGPHPVEVERGGLHGVLRRYVLTLEAVAQPRGRGVRWWCWCGQCGVLRRALYTKPGASRALCRECLDLAYESQRLARDARLARRARSLGRKLGAWDVFPAAFARGVAERLGTPAPEIVDVEQVVDDGVIPKRPRGMHRTTYRALRADLERTLDERNDIVREALQDLLDRNRTGRRRA